MFDLLKKMMSKVTRNIMGQSKTEFTQETNNRNIGHFEHSDNNKFSHNVMGNVNEQHNYYLLSTDIGLIEKSKDNSYQQEITRRIKEIETLQEEGRYESAIKAYSKIAEDYLDKRIDDGSKFLILNGFLNCYLNMNDDDNVNRYIEKIKLLGDVPNIERFHFLCSIYYLNKRSLDKSYKEISRALEIKPDYFKAVSLKYLIESQLGKIDYSTVEKAFIDEFGNPLLGTGSKKDNAYLFDMLGYICWSLEQNELAIKYFEKAYKLMPSYSKKALIGEAHFKKAVEKSKGQDYIEPKYVDFDELNHAITIFDELYYLDDLELRNQIRMQISQLYFKCLFLTNNYSRLERIFNENNNPLLNEKDEFFRIKAFTELTKGKVNSETYKELSPKDKEWFHFIELLNKERYEILITELEPFIWNKYKEDYRFHGILLQSYLSVDDIPSSTTHMRKIRDLGIENDIITLSEGFYYEKTGDLGKAEQILKETAIKGQDYHFYFELIYFYERNKLFTQLNDLYEELFNHRIEVVNQSKQNFLYRYYLFLKRNNMSIKLVQFFETIDLSDFEEKKYLIIEANVLFVSGNFRIAATKYEELYYKYDDLNDLFNCLIAYMASNNIEKAEEVAKILIRRDYPNISSIYAAYSNIELLKGNCDLSYDYAKKAKDTDKDKFNSNAHPFYIQRSLRCNKEEGVSYIGEYTFNFPNYQVWLKQLKVIETDEQGNEKPTKELLEFLDSRKRQFELFVGAYRNNVIGMAAVAKGFGLTTIEILDWREIYNLKVNISAGLLEEVEKEIENFEDKIILDVLGLYLLAEIGYLGLLSRFNKVYITYSTIADLHHTLMNVEKPLVREILNHINQSLNIVIVPVDIKMSTELNQKYEKVLQTCQVDSIVYSQSTGIIPYVYSDFLIKKLTDNNTSLISLIALFRAMNRRDLISGEELSDIVLNLKKRRYGFVNFNSEDMYNIAQKSNFAVDENILLFFQLHRSIDFPSFIRVFLGFLNSLYVKIERNKFLAYCDLYVRTFDNYYKKYRYCDYWVKRYYGEESGSLLNAFLDESPDLRRALFIRVCCESALKFLLHLFKDSEEDYQFFSNRLKEIVTNISPKEVEKIIIEGKLPLARENNNLLIE